MSKTTPKRMFVELDTLDGGADQFSRGFYYARKYPKHEFMDVTSTEDFELGLVYLGEQPTSAEILTMLAADPDYAEYLEQYRSELEEEMNDAAADMIEN